MPDVIAATPANPISAKVAAGGVAGAMATLFWVVAANTFLHGVFNDSALTALTGASTTLFGAILGYFVKDPLRQV